MLRIQFLNCFKKMRYWKKSKNWNEWLKAVTSIWSIQNERRRMRMRKWAKKLSLIRIHVFKMLYALWNILQKNFFFYFSNKNKRNRDKCVTSIHAYLFSLKGRILLTQHHSRIHSTNVCVCVWDSIFKWIDAGYQEFEYVLHL